MDGFKGFIALGLLSAVAILTFVVFKRRKKQRANGQSQASLLDWLRPAIRGRQQWRLAAHDHQKPAELGTEGDQDLEVVVRSTPLQSDVFAGPQPSSFMRLHQPRGNQESPIFAQIEATVLEALGTHRLKPFCSNMVCRDSKCLSSILLKTDWKPLEFLEDQFGKDLPQLRQVLSYTGIASAAFAAPCIEYLTYTWHISGLIVLEAVEDYLQNLSKQADAGLNFRIHG